MKAGIVAFAFGVPANVRSNKTIARIVADKASILKAPIFTQQDIQFTSPNIEVKTQVNLEVERIKEKLGNPPPTLRIARAAVHWARQRGIRELWIVAAGPHVWRCERDLKYAVSGSGAKIAIRVCEKIKQSKDSSWYCQDSSQPRTRSSFSWWSREIVLRLMPMFLYKRIAG